jgi:hypothetical protein
MLKPAMRYKSCVKEPSMRWKVRQDGETASPLTGFVYIPVGLGLSMGGKGEMRRVHSDICVCRGRGETVLGQRK